MTIPKSLLPFVVLLCSTLNAGNTPWSVSNPQPVTPPSPTSNFAGEPQDWTIVTSLLQQYQLTRSLVRDAYIEVKSWQAIKANWEATKTWFDYNKERWNRIGRTLNNLSAESPKDFINSMKQVEDQTRTIDDFVMVQPLVFDRLMQTYEGNLSQMLDTATDIARLTMGASIASKIPRSDVVWGALQNYAYSVSGEQNPINDQYAKDYASMGIKPYQIGRIYDLEEWRRMDFLEAGISISQAQNNLSRALLVNRQEFWKQFAQAAASIESKRDGASSGQMLDVLQRTQTMADQTDHILNKMNEQQILLLDEGEQVYKASAELAKHVDFINSVQEMKAELRRQRKILGI